ncbi:aldehyde dehydrogenase family protein, partial [Raoultella ornithinolytica]|uniref:aldehyde dehydrogenase family protein n=1 Tax=Raoultella ornithinolytica TaxID=54291 RepID=UPI000CBB2C55
MNDLDITQAVSRVLSKYTKTTAPAPEQPAPAAATPLDRGSIDAIVASVLASQAGAAPAAPVDGSAGDGVFATMDAAITAAQQAYIQYRHCSMQDRARFVDGIRQFFLQEEILHALSTMAVEETGMGNYADKMVKNRVAAQKTPGVEDLITAAISGDGGLTLTEYSAYGVIGSITPTTNPTETIINNTLGMLAAGNAVVFSPHPRSRQVSLYCVTLINQQLARLGDRDHQT